MLHPRKEHTKSGDTAKLGGKRRSVKVIGDKHGRKNHMHVKRQAKKSI